MLRPTTWLPQIYQRFRSFWDRAVPAAGLALMLWASAEATGAFPREWRVFFAVMLFLVGLGWPASAYVAFTFLVAYPLYRISIYFAAIVLAVLILTSHWAMRRLGAAVLVLLTPVLLPLHLGAAVPLLAGLWWGDLTGALVGGLSALWLKLLAGMAGQPLDLVRLSGWTPAGAGVVERFSGLNSLQTLLELVNPFADTSQMLLLHVLQVLAWAAAGYVAGRLARRTWSDRWRGWVPPLSVAPAMAVLWACYVWLPGLLIRLETVIITERRELTLWLAASGWVAACARMFYDYLRRPLLRPARQRFAPTPEAERHDEAAAHPPLDWKPPKRARPASDADEDVIMLEID